MSRVFAFPKRKMNLEKTITLLGQLQTILSVLEQLPDDCRKTVLGTLASNGLDAGLIARNAVKTKHGLQAVPKVNFSTLADISTTHLAMSVREAINNDVCHKWGVVLYTNEYGAFMAIIDGMKPNHSAPQSLVQVYEWASDRGFGWVKFDRDTHEVKGLPCYGDGDEQLTEDDVVLST